MKLAAICFTKAGYELLTKLNSILPEMGYETDSRCKSKAVREAVEKKNPAEAHPYQTSEIPGDTWINNVMPAPDSRIRFLETSTEEWAAEHFAQGHVLLFIGATGIAVRSIASSVKSKLMDPPVLVMDDRGQYVIPLLSGHMGGANELARLIGEKVGALPIITTATDNHRAFAVDLFARKNHLYFHRKEDIARISSRVLAGQKITIVVESGAIPMDKVSDVDKCTFEERHRGEISLFTEEEWGKVEDSARSGIPGSDVEQSAGNGVDLWIGGRRTDLPEELPRLLPKEYVVGIGCKRGKNYAEITAFVDNCLEQAGLVWEQVYAFASIDRKADEVGIVTLAESKRIPFLTFTAEELDAVPGDFHESEFVKQQMGVGSVCERAAAAGCLNESAAGCPNAAIAAGRFADQPQSDEAYQMILPKQALDGMTCAIAKRKWRMTYYE